MNGNTHLSDIVETRKARDAGAAGTGTGNGDTIDMAGSDGVRFTLGVTTILNTGTIQLKAQQGDASDASDMADIAGATQTLTSAADNDKNNKLMIIDVLRPSKRYVRSVVVRATANSAHGPVIGERYRLRNEPVTQHADVAAITKQAPAA